MQGKTAIVTGSGRGIGRAIAVSYAIAGANVVLTSRTESELKDVQQYIGQKGGPDSLSFRADLRNNGDVRNLVQATTDRFQTVDILVNNAGAPGRNVSFNENTDDEWKELMDVNVLGPVRCMRAVLPYMRKAKRGNIINISSGAGVKRPRKSIRSIPYTVSKFAIEGLTHAVSVELQGTGINVNAIRPGFIRSGFQSTWSEEEISRQIKAVGNMKEPETVVGVALFLASLKPGEMTGESLTPEEGEQLLKRERTSNRIPSSG